jgi:magnesium-transporting ATPase (P-type)
MKRRRADKEENEREVLVLDPDHRFVARHWQDLQVGSIVKITKN